MKRLIFILILALVSAAGCREKQTDAYVRLGDFTPASGFQEKLYGKVESVVEKTYWAIPQGDSYIKGAKLTRNEIDSLGFSYDFKAKFDVDGKLVSCTTIDENDGIIDRWEMKKVNDIVTRAELVSGDTLKSYVIISAKDDGLPYLYESFDALTDTLKQRVNQTGLEISDTIRMEAFDPAVKLKVKAISVYNEIGLVTFLGRYKADGTPEVKVEIKYNESGFMTEINGTDFETNKNTKLICTYTQVDRGNWVKAIAIDHEDRIFITERVFTYFE